MAKPIRTPMETHCNHLFVTDLFFFGSLVFWSVESRNAIIQAMSISPAFSSRATPYTPIGSGRPRRDESGRPELGSSSDREQERRERDIESNKGKACANNLTANCRAVLRKSPLFGGHSEKKRGDMHQTPPSRTLLPLLSLTTESRFNHSAPHTYVS